MRFISFKKEGTIGIRLIGGNQTGIFVGYVQPDSAAAVQGVQVGDKIIKMNGMEMKGVTREEAVLFLLSTQEHVDLVVQYRKDLLEEALQKNGDSFHIKTHFNHESSEKGTLSFHSGEIFHVINTMYNDVIGSWEVYRLGRNNQEIQSGVIPSKKVAEQLAAEQAAEKTKKDSVGRGSFFKRRSRRSKAFSKDSGDELSGDSSFKFPAYEQVYLKHPGFIRPVVIFGPLADVAREKLLKDYPDKYGSPQFDSQFDEVDKYEKALTVVRLSAIREIVDKGKHALLEIIPNAVERLNYAQFYPIVILMRAENKSIIKELRMRSTKTQSKSSRKLYDQSVKLEKNWSHIFTATITLTNADMWYKKLREIIEIQQHQTIWVSNTKPDETISDDFLFPTTSRLSYASSPESDLEISNDLREDEQEPGPRLVKASSDPSIAPADDLANGVPNSFSPPYDMHSNKQTPLHILLRKVFLISF